MKKFKFIIEKSAPASFVVEAENIIQAEEIMRDKKLIKSIGLILNLVKKL